MPRRGCGLMRSCSRKTRARHCSRRSRWQLVTMMGSRSRPECYRCNHHRRVAMSILSCALFVMLSVSGAKMELAKWQGTWEVELMVFDGKEKPAKERNIAKVI